MTFSSPVEPQHAALRMHLLAALAPLRFAARNAFAQLGRVRDLEPTLARAIEALRPVASGHGDRVNALLALLPGPRLAPSERQARLTELLRQLEMWCATCAAPEARPQDAASVTAATPRPLRRSAAKQPPSAARPAAQVPIATVPARRQQNIEVCEGQVVPRLDDALHRVRGIGPRLAQALASRHLHTVSDLLHFLPRRYQGLSGGQCIAELVADSVASVEGQVQRVADRFVKGRHTLEVVLADATGSVHLVWFRVPGRGFAAQFKRGAHFRAAGTVKRYRQALQIAHPETRRLDDLGVASADAAAPTPGGAPTATQDSIVPLYLEIEGVHPNQLRRLIDAALPALVHLEDPLPEALRLRRTLLPLREALHGLHAPPADTDGDALEGQATPWHRRLIYDECFFLQLGLLYRRQDAARRQDGVALRPKRPLAALAAALLPFTLTEAQTRALADVEADMTRTEPMQRLLQGDVGSGKTAVALVAAAAAAQAGLQAAIMAPTELLAEQHARVFHRVLAPHGLEVLLHTGQQSPAQRRTNLKAIAAGQAQVVVGTHALIQADVRFARLGLAVIDEQHRFGVLQRARLTQPAVTGGSHAPHLLVMTATPIPRTLALTAYGDLELSLIDSLPPGRTPVTTRLYTDGQRSQVYAAVRSAVAQGQQAYVVFPLVEVSDKEGMTEIRAATKEAAELEAGVLHGLRLGLLHGRLSREEKDAVMQAFLRRDIDVLVATTVIEVGIDVANASVMVIEHAERFGLSQLHQLRGRVGRGAAMSFCYLLSRFRPSETAWRRLGIMEETSDGFRIAEEDLAIRGPGDFMGTRQSGLPILSMTNLARDAALLVQARTDAQQVLSNDPKLSAPQHAAMRSRLTGLWQEKLQLASLT